MSNRVLKKLQGDNNELVHQNVEMSGSESDSTIDKTGETTKKGRKLAINRFELLNSLDHNSMSDTEAKEDDDNDNESAGFVNLADIKTGSRKKLEKQDSTQSTDSLKKKKKKKKKLRSQKSLEGQLDDIDATVEEVNRILGDAIKDDKIAAKRDDQQQKTLKKNVLCVEHRHLNPDNELKRIFGSKVIQAEQSSINRRRGRGNRNFVGKSWMLVNPKNWNNIGKTGMSMELVETKDGVYYFTFVHSKSYQSVQFQFLDAVESFNPDNLVAILNDHPYHIDTLIQFSDVCKMGEDQQMAAELIERALHCIEHSFHPLFNLSQGNCRLDYKRPENRSFFIALFKHLTFVGQRGCNRTALEFCKLLLGLDPEGDPLCVLLMIDYFAIRSMQYDYLINLYVEWNPIKKLSLFPNFLFSVSLAMYLRSQNASNLLEKQKADEQLQEALIMFPEVLLLLLDKCNVEPDSRVLKCRYLDCNAQKIPPAISQLVSLFVGRSHLLWKDKDVMLWLEDNVNQVIRRVEAKDHYIDVCIEKRKKYFAQPTPRNVLRHVILSGIKEATTALPSDLTHSAIFGFDPLPPLDSIISYVRPQRPAQIIGNDTVENDRGLLSVFLRSWLPEFNDLDPERNRAAQIAQQVDQDQEQGAVGREPGDTSELRRSVTSLLDAMRDLLSNFQMADVQNEGDVESDDEEENR